MKRGDTEESKDLIINACAVEEAQSKIQEGEPSGDNSPLEGRWRWVVCLGVFVVNFVTVGQQNSAGVVYDVMMDTFSKPKGETGTNLKVHL